MDYPTPEDNAAPAPTYAQGYGKLTWLLLVILFIPLGFAGIALVSQSNPQKNTPPPAQAPSPTPDPTKDWLIYVNDEQGFQFKYPSSLFTKTSPRFPNTTFVMLYDSDLETVTAKIFADLTISTQLGTNEAKINEVKQGLQNPVDESVTIDGIVGRKVSGILTVTPEGIFRSYIVLVKDSKTITFDFYELEPDKLNNETFSQMLSTFKFSNQSTGEGKFCGGIAGIQCPSSYSCQLDGNYPDAGGKCTKDTGVVCTQEALECPDGSFVGRTGPKCEFAACPKPN